MMKNLQASHEKPAHYKRQPEMLKMLKAESQKKIPFIFKQVVPKIKKKSCNL